MTDQNEPGDTITVHRRRPAGPASGPRERADAPERQRDEDLGSGGGGPPGGGGSGGGRSGLPAGLPRGGCGTVALVVILILAFILLRPGGGGNQPPTENVAQEPPATQEPAAAMPVPTRPHAAPAQAAASQATAPAPPAASGAGQKWTVMLYQDADDKVLEQDIFFDLNEAERVGSNARVNIVAQTDRYRGGFQSNGDWVGARRYYVTHDDDLNRVNSRLLQDLGPVNMSDSQSLVDFVTWAMAQYPADKYVLILSDHGMGWPGGFTDAGSGRHQLANVPLSAGFTNAMYLMELDKALGDIRAQTKLDKFELVGLDACLMSQLEVYDMLAAHARYAVASEETEPALGWAYTAFLSALARDPDSSGAGLARQIVQSYITQDERIVDDQARADYMRQGSPMGGLYASLGSPGPAQLARQLGDSVTLTAVDLSALPAVMQSVNDFAFALQAVPQPPLDEARNYAQSYTSIFGSDVPASYVDLGHLTALAARTLNKPEVTKAATAVLTALKSAIVAEKHGPKKPGSTGVAIYFPNAQLYRSAMAGPRSYIPVAQRFAADSLWDDFLAFHYTGRRFVQADRAPVMPDRSATIAAPGAGQVAVSPVRLSANSVTPGKTLNMQADVTGANVGYVYFFTGFLDKPHNSLNVADTDYLESPQSRQLNGVYYPDWGGRTRFTLNFDWEPLMFSISDGKTSAQVLLTPQSYGAAPEQAVYTVDGIYTSAQGGDTRFARLYFSNGLLRQVMGFAGDQPDGTGAPHEITPQAGDRFTVLAKWYDLDARGAVQQAATQKGKTLTFGDQTFTWQQLDAAAGDYVIGFIVEDLDGNRVQSFAPVKVQ